MPDTSVGNSGPQDMNLLSWPKNPLELSSLNSGYTRDGFIQQTAMQLFAATNFDGKNPTVEANRCVQYAGILANILGLK